MDVQKPASISPSQFAGPGTARVRPLLLKPQWMNGLSERLLISHYENNYGGAVLRLNAIRARLAALDWARIGFQVSGTAVTELRRRGYDARALAGGITAWHAIGGTTVPLDTSNLRGSGRVAWWHGLTRGNRRPLGVLGTALAAAYVIASILTVALTL